MQTGTEQKDTQRQVERNRINRNRTGREQTGRHTDIHANRGTNTDKGRKMVGKGEKPSIS